MRHVLLHSSLQDRNFRCAGVEYSRVGAGGRSPRPPTPCQLPDRASLEGDSLEAGVGTVPWTFPLLKYISAGFSLCKKCTRTAHTDVKLLFCQLCFERIYGKQPKLYTSAPVLV